LISDLPILVKVFPSSFVVENKGFLERKACTSFLASSPYSISLLQLQLRRLQQNLDFDDSRSWK